MLINLQESLLLLLLFMLEEECAVCVRKDAVDSKWMPHDAADTAAVGAAVAVARMRRRFLCTLGEVDDRSQRDALLHVGECIIDLFQVHRVSDVLIHHQVAGHVGIHQFGDAVSALPATKCATLPDSSGD